MVVDVNVNVNANVNVNVGANVDVQRNGLKLPTRGQPRPPDKSGGSGGCLPVRSDAQLPSDKCW